jgi:hypothetical protein
MKPSLKLGALFLLFFAAVAMLIGIETQKARIAATHSAAASLLKSLGVLLSVNSFEEQWKVLKEAEYVTLLDLLQERGASLDACPQCHTASGLLGDVWGRRFQIAGRKRSDGTNQFIVWSQGPDGLSGTTDDIVVPENSAAEHNEILGLATDENEVIERHAL